TYRKTINQWIFKDSERATGVEPARPAWEFSNEIDIFSFTHASLVLIFNPKVLVFKSSNFNCFQRFYFCLGHVLGTRFFVLLHAKILSFSKKVRLYDCYAHT